MLTTLRIAFRNTSRQRRRTLLLAGAIGFGFFVITLLNSATGGLEEAMELNFASLLGGHVYVSGEEMLPSGRIVSSVQDPEAIRRAVDELEAEVSSVTRRSRANADVIFGSRSQTLLIDGVDFDAEPELLEGLVPIEGSVTEISESSNGIILPAELAGELRVVPGEVVILRLSTVTGQSSVGELELVATVEEAQGLGISRGYVHLERMNELIGLDPGNFQSLNLYLEQPARMNQVARELTAIIGNDLQVVSRDSEQGAGFAGLGFGGDEEEPWDGVRYAVSTLDDILGQVLAVLQTLDLVALAVFAVLLLITMVGITNTYRMVVLERRQEIGTMRAVGMQRGQVLRLFIAEAALTAVYGLVIGGALAALLMVLIGLIPIASPALQFFLIEGKLAFSLPIGTAVRNVLIVLVLAIFAAFFPARGASRMRPVDALRATA